MGRIQVDVLGSNFVIQAQEGEEYLNKLLSYYKDIVDTVQHSARLDDPMQVSIIAGITLVDELYKAKTASVSSEMEDFKVHEILQGMIEQLNLSNL